MKSRRLFFAGITGFTSAFCIVAGKSLDVDYALPIKEPAFYIKWLIFSVLLGGLIYAIWLFWENTPILNAAYPKILQKAGKFESKLKGYMIVIFLVVMWIPAWLSIFPGAFSYDAYDEWQQVHLGNITAHHPVLHVLLLGGLVENIFRLTGSYNAGIAIYVLMQMFLLAAVFTYTIQFLREQMINPLLRLFAILFYACSPVIKLFANCATKDVLFTASLLLFIINMWRICISPELFFKKISWQIMFCISGFFSMVMRNNGFYAIIISFIILLPLCRKYFIKYIRVLAVTGILYFIYIGPFYNIVQVSPGGLQEMLSVPLQQLARVYCYDKETYTIEEIEYLEKIVAQENWERYRPTVADYVKSGFIQEEYMKNPAQFWNIWIQTGCKKPLTYVNSFLLGIVDYIYPFAIIDGYQDVYGASSFFDYKVSPPGEVQVLLPRLHNIYEKVSTDKETQKLPGMFLLLSPGWYLMILVVLFMYLWYKKSYRQLIPLVVVLLYFATLFLGPIALVRYVLILYYLFPVYCVFLHKN